MSRVWFACVLSVECRIDDLYYITDLHAEVVIKLQKPTYEVIESKGVIVVCVELVGQTNEAVVAHLNTSTDPGQYLLVRGICTMQLAICLI